MWLQSQNWLNEIDDPFPGLTQTPNHLLESLKKVVTPAVTHVQVLNYLTSLHNTFGKEGGGKGQFSYLWSIACDKTGKVFVADIEVFTAKRRILMMFGKHSQGKGKLA